MKQTTFSNFLFLFLILFGISIHAQQPVIQWQKCYGGSYPDIATDVHQTTDGGYIVAGYTGSNDDDVIGHHGGTYIADYWIVKLNPAGTVQWKKAFGGTYDDAAYSIEQTSDGGYIVAGYSFSIDGDVTGHHGVINFPDYWIVKLDSGGNMQWQKSLGGSMSDFGYSVQQTTDGGYIVAGQSNSQDGDVLSNTNTTFGYWIVKLNSSGTIVWEKTFGGTSHDIASCIRQTTDGGYIVAGHSSSTNGDVTGNHGGGRDYWIVKLDTGGTLQWQKSLGGIYMDSAICVRQTFDGGYIVAGGARSHDGDVTAHHGTLSISDYWITKLDANGTLQWEKSLGGSNEDIAYSIEQTVDSGYVIAGYTTSSEGDITGHYGGSDYWIVKLYADGNIDWKRCYGGSGVDGATSIKQTTDNGYIVAGASSSTDHNATGSGNHGGQDFWIVKLGAFVDINESSSENLGISIFPNPSANILTISNQKSFIRNIDIHNVMGEKIYSHEPDNSNAQPVTINVADFLPGVYFVKVKMTNGESTLKFMKQ